jgi:predicted nucleotide-binding protein
MGMIDRFQGEEAKPRLIEALRRQSVVRDDEQLANELAKRASVVEVGPGEILIRQDAPDDDIFFILAGRFSVLVHDREVAVRSAGQHVGEMALIDPAARRSATVAAIEESVAARVAEPAFTEIANTNPRLWRALALELGTRLRERNRLVAAKNPRPVLFLGSSKESLPVARTIQEGLRHDDILVRVWTDGVFGASKFPIEALEEQVSTSDFAAVVLGPDDVLISRGDEISAPRDNTVFELGLFMGALSRRRSFLVVPSEQDIQIPSDLLGLIPLKYKAGREEDLPALMGPTCSELRKIILKMGPK